MKKFKILLAEDETMIGQILKEYLLSKGFLVELVPNGNKAYSKFYEYKPDMCLFDIGMPEKDGFDLIEEIRKQNSEVPVIFISSNSSTNDVVRGFQLGCNDYVKKPFVMEELVARINAQLKRAPLVDSEYCDHIGSLFFNSRTQMLSNGEKDFRLTYRESSLLKRLIEKKNEILCRKSVLEELWGEDNSFNARSMDVFISRLRTYFKDDRRVDILNIRGIGHKMICNN